MWWWPPSVARWRFSTFLWAVTGLLAATAAIDFATPGGPAFMLVENVRDVTMPWGEVIRMVDGTPLAGRIIGDARRF